MPGAISRARARGRDALYSSRRIVSTARGDFASPVPHDTADGYGCGSGDSRARHREARHCASSALVEQKYLRDRRNDARRMADIKRETLLEPPRRETSRSVPLHRPLPRLTDRNSPILEPGLRTDSRARF